MSVSTLWGDPDVQALFMEGGAAYERIQAAKNRLSSLDGPTDPAEIGRLRGEVSALMFLRHHLEETSKKKEAPRPGARPSSPPQAVRRTR